MRSIRNTLTILTIFFGTASYSQNTLSLTDLRCESMVNPIGISELSPGFSWRIASSGRDVRQSGYHILVADSEEKLRNNEGSCWDSKFVTSDVSVQIICQGAALQSEKRYFWKVKIRDQAGHESAWSETAWFQTGLLTTADWGKARWIGYENLPDSLKIVPGIHGYGDDLGTKGVKRSVVPMFRKEFEVRQEIHNATLYISGLGHYEASVNSGKVGQSFLAPGWTDYDKRCLYNTCDLTPQLKQGKNVIGVVVGNGFYNINRERYRKLVIAYGYPKMICKLKINYKDGTSEEIVSGTDWRCAPSPIGYS
ncbi:MAG TPA: alpha-L-rhamnosidase N-terminal domain-containing protein, partial [Prolixibacteraceae bacterium]|nr:alpha-L-rhamnosidase N-terminal domain-containing protein [Prolixibacteraceae bacterium]